MKTLKELSFFLMIGIVITGIAYAIESAFIFTYIHENIISLILTLLAINTATSGLVASKIQDIALQYNGIDFRPTLKEMKKSLVQQIVLIIIAFAVLLIVDSSIIDFLYKVEICNSILVSVFAFAVYALWDTGQSVFIIIDELNNLKKK